VPTKYHGLLVGKRGMTVKEIQRETGVCVCPRESARARARICLCLCLCLCPCLDCVCVCVLCLSMSVSVCLGLFECVHFCVFVWRICGCVYTCAYVQTCMHTPTHLKACAYVYTQTQIHTHTHFARTSAVVECESGCECGVLRVCTCVAV